MSPSGLVAVTVNGSASAALTYWPGDEIETVGAWLSRFTVTGVEARELPALSVATARTSYAPSASGVVFQSDGVDVQLPAPLGEYWNAIEGDGRRRAETRVAGRVGRRRVEGAAGVVGDADGEAGGGEGGGRAGRGDGARAGGVRVELDRRAGLRRAR